MIAAVVLAAGASTRLGRPKALVERLGRPLVVHAVDCAARGGCGPVFVVLGADAELVQRALRGTPARPVVNPGWREGVASSIRAGIRAAAAHDPPADGAVLLACDQPLLTADVVRRLREAVETGGGRLAACVYRGTVGIPAAFGAARFGELEALSGDGGAKRVLLRHAAELVRLDWEAGARDVDRPEDLDGLPRLGGE